MRDELVDRFYDKVDIGGPDECWPWTGYAQRHRGRFRFQGQPRPASRVAWIIENGRPPDGVVIHLCDDTLCVNPDHLRDRESRERRRDSRGRYRALRDAGEVHQEAG